MGRLFRAILVLVLVFVSGCFVPVTHEGSTCVLCRTYRRVTTYGFVPVTRYHETECSCWYAAHIEPRHAHIWERGTCVSESDLWGFTRSVGCCPGRFPIWLLPPETQLAAYQHFQDPLEARALFAGLTDARTHDDRLDEHDEDRGHLTVRAIEEWAAAGFPATWREWWDGWWAKHVAEHEEWLEWLHDDSGLNFWDWQKKRKAAVAAS